MSRLDSINISSPTGRGLGSEFLNLLISACAVVPQPERNCFRCPCHEGFFDLTTGEPIAGPPRRRLPKINLEIKGGAIYASGVEEQAI